MSIELVQKEVSRFLQSAEPEVLCLKGSWGVGKTYSWNKWVSEAAKSQNAISLKIYSYVSLFGVTSIAELQQSIFQNSRSIDQIDKIPSVDTLGKTFGEQLKGNWRRHVRWLRFLPQAREYFPGVDALLSHFFVKEQIICLDDLERGGRGILLSDVMGVVSHLKEEKHCKVVLILNDQRLEGENAEAFNKYLEKTVDVFLEFDPTSTECVAIALHANSKMHDELWQDCLKLGISNIRVIRKIERIAKLVLPIIEDLDDRVLQSAIKSLTLFGWSIYSDESPDIAFIRRSTRGLFGGRAEGRELSDEERL